MPAEASLVQESWDRVNAAYGSIQEEAQRLQKQLNTRRKSFEKQLNTSRKSIERQLNTGRRTIEKRTRKQVNQVRSELRRNGWFKRVRSLQDDVSRQLESGIDTLLGALQIASKSDVDRIDRKLSQLNRKLKEIERVRKTNGQAPSATV